MRISPHVRGLQAVITSSIALVGALLWQPCAAQMPMPPDAASAANPAANVPAVRYQSVFKETTLGVEKDREDWRIANDRVGQFTRGHMDILKWEEQESAKTMAKPATPQPANMPAPKPEAIKPIAAPAHKH